MMTRWTEPPRWAAAAARLVKIPVDSITTSTPREAHGSWDGSRSAMTRIWRSPTRRSSPSTWTGTDRRPWVES